MKKRYSLVAEIESFSHPGKFYQVKRDDDTGKLSCNCPAWIFNHSGDRQCKHTRVVGNKLYSVVARPDEVLRGKEVSKTRIDFVLEEVKR